MSEETNLFEYATRYALRFNYKGTINVEDLWQLKEEELSAIYSELMKQLQVYSEFSLLEKDNKEKKVLSVKIAIVTYIFNKKQQERKDKIEADKNREQKAKLIALLEEKENEEYRNMTKEELKSLIDNL